VERKMENDRPENDREVIWPMVSSLTDILAPISGPSMMSRNQLAAGQKNPRGRMPLQKRGKGGPSEKLHN
jgi:hypothetical protein